MLRSISDLRDYSIEATDGNVGVLKDLYFEDDSWVIRYLVVQTGHWLASREVLISPISVGTPGWSEKVLAVSITQDQVRHSPPIDTDKPVSRQHEREYFDYYNYPYYWGGLGMWGVGYYPGYLRPGFREDESDADHRKQYARRAQAAGEDPHLRSCRAVIGYRIEATDGEIGHVRNLLVDDRTWAIRYLVADTSNWWVGHQVLIAPEWIGAVSWESKSVDVRLTRQAVKDSPPYSGTADFSASEQASLTQHYEHSSGWPIEAARKHDVARLQA